MSGVNGNNKLQGFFAWRGVAWVSGLFIALLGLSMFVAQIGTKAEDPLKSVELKALKEQLRGNPNDQALKERIRQLDLRLRTTYFRQLSRTRVGVILLLSGAGLFVVAFTKAKGARKIFPAMNMEPKTEESLAAARARTRTAVMVTGICVGAFLLLLSRGLSSAIPERVAKAGGTNGADVSDYAPTEELQRNWTRFLGPNGNNSTTASAPISWDASKGSGIAWKVPVPISGFNSPIVWGDRIFLSGGDAQKREVMCFDGTDGRVVWREAVASPAGFPAQEIPETTGYAASTMATDGRRVYVMFASGDVAAFGLNGKLVWSKNFGPLKNPYGHAISLAMDKDRLILQLDQGEAEEGKSKLVALNGRTGEVVWQTARKLGSSWASPVVYEAAGKTQIATLSLPWAIGYNAADGAELWKVDCLSGEITPSPIFAGGLVIVASPSDKVLAIRPDGSGDVTKTHVAWKNEDNVPDVTSPASNGELVFGLSTSGVLTCLDAREGKKLWEHDYEMEFHASPAIAGTNVYLLGQKGASIVVGATREFKEVLRTELPDAFHASPALVQDAIYLRGVTNLWRLGATGRKKP